MKYVSDERDYKDPVCGMLVSRLTAAAEARHEGKVYYFCAPECRDVFVADPAEYVARHRQHGVSPKSGKPR